MKSSRIGMAGAVAALVGVCGLAMADAVDVCADAVETPGGTYAFDLSVATPDGYTNSCGFGSATSVDVWFKHTAAVSGTMSVTTCGLASFDTVLSAFDGCGGSQLACQDDSCGSLQSTISFGVTAGQVVYIRVCGYNGAIGAGSVTITAPTPPPPGTLLESGDAGDTPATAQQANTETGNLPTIVGSLGASDADMYLIGICEPANFSATTVNADTTLDTQLFLFDENGTAIVMDDDDPAGSGLQSALSNAFTSSLQAGNYLLAVSQYNKDPINSLGAYIWENLPFNVERAPDGLNNGGDLVVTGFDANGGGGGGYHINLTGACYVGATSNCVADVDNGSGTGTPDGAVTIDDLLYFLAQFESGAAGADVDNGTGTGTTDGAVTIDDLLYFLVRFEAGC